MTDDEDLFRINNEQANALRAALKETSLQRRGQLERDSFLYDELSRLNNELTTAQRELAKKNAELTRLNEQKNQFLGFASHDLRNPLEVILTYSGFLLEDAAASLSAEQAEFVRVIRSSSGRMLRLVEELLDVARIEAGRLELELAPADLGALVRGNVARSRALAAKKGIEIDLAEEPGGLPSLRLDAGKIEQVLDNLIGNAVKFSPPDSRVEVRVAREPHWAVVSVRDQGPGIPPDLVERLFQPFARGRLPGTQGAGLGLAIVKGILAGHGGTIRVDSEPGRGATFHACLPLGGAS